MAMKREEFVTRQRNVRADIMGISLGKHIDSNDHGRKKIAKASKVPNIEGVHKGAIVVCENGRRV